MLKSFVLMLLTMGASCGPLLIPVQHTTRGNFKCWNVDELRPGMQGYGLSVFQGTRIERFEATIIGVLKNTSPGRDMVLARLSGCDLERTGVIAGMSGSPVYIEGKLVGAVAYSWAYGKDPIAGITPYPQMAAYCDKPHLSRPSGPIAKRIFPLDVPVQVQSGMIDRIGVAPNAAAGPGEGGWMIPLRTPLATAGFSERSLRLLREQLGDLDLVPVQSGSVAKHVLTANSDAPLTAGAPLAVSLVTGDFDISGIGTLTHIEGKRVYGWGHPFMSLGGCGLPMMAGYIHTIYPRQTVSFKLGSPLRCVGVIDADTSTGIAGNLQEVPDMMPITSTVQRDPSAPPRTFRCQIARHKQLLPQLVFAVLTNSADMEGELPEELTAEFDMRIELVGHPPIVLQDVFSGGSYAGSRAAIALYSQVGALFQNLLNNPFEDVRILSVHCTTRFTPVRRYAEIDGVRLHSDELAPGDPLKVTVFLQLYKGRRERLHLRIPLPNNLPEGTYSAVLCDDPANLRASMRTNPTLLNPQSIEQVLEGLRHISSARRSHLAVRINLPQQGIALEQENLPQLPGSIAEMLSESKNAKALPLRSARVTHHATDWCLQGSETIRFTVRNRVSTPQP